MGETAQTIIQNKGIFITRNTPVALVLGAGKFLGSHLVEGLIDKNIQVIGVDNFNIGKRENLDIATKSNKFHLVNNLNQENILALERLDYLFIDADKETNINEILRVFKEKKCRILLISSIELYKTSESGGLEWLKEAEIKVAKFAKLHNLNARVLRLGMIYGPRMDFKENDPINRIILAALKEDLQKEIDLEFSTRALYIDDAVELTIKTILSGSTALKIFDGVLPTPIKVAEIKQVLLDPIWYEERGFIPTELPPWPTPNLDKTIKQLNWKPKTKLVYALKQTLNYFKTHEVKLPEDEKIELPKEKKELYTKEVESKPEKIEKKKRLNLPNITSYLVIGIIFYALIWPLISIGWGVFSFKLNLSEASRHLEKGEFAESLENVESAKNGVEEAKKLLIYIEPLKMTGFFRSYEDLINLASLSQHSAKSTILGIQALYQGLKAVTGEMTEGASNYFKTAQIELAQADEEVSKARALSSGEEFQKNLPGILRERVNSLTGKMLAYEDVIKKGRASALLLPEIIGLNGKKTYLILLQNNMELRPGGGFIGSFARLGFEGGKLKKLEVNDVYAADGQLKIHVEPPKEIKDDLGQKDWYLRDSNYEPDFPTNARQAEWFYTKETGESVDGVIALDVSALENLLQVVGPLDLADYNEKVTSENLFEKAITHAEQGFFPGSQEKKTFLTALTLELFNKIFFLPKQNWPGIVGALGISLQEKHFNVYLEDPKLFSYLNSQGWTGAMPTGLTKNDNEVIDFLAPVEANLGANKANYYIDRSYKLETAIGKDGEISHKLKISYTNRSPGDTWPGGLYKNRFRIYLPLGTKLTEAKWAGEDITKDVMNFTDYGRSGFSMLVKLEAKTQKELILSYQLPENLKFVNNLAKYQLNVVKQAGTLKDNLQWSINYPINYKIASDQNQSTPQEKVISTDLSVDRNFELSFSKSL